MASIRKTQMNDGSVVYHKALYKTIFKDNTESESLFDKLNSIDNAIAANTKKIDTDLGNHLSNTSNPHSVTKAQVGLGNCDNTADSGKNVRSAGIVRDCGNGYNITISYAKAGIDSTPWLAAWNEYELRAISPDKLMNSANILGTIHYGGYHGIRLPGGDVTDYLRTTSNGIIPYTNGGASYVGTSAWPFLAMYANTFYEGGSSLASKYASINHSHSGYAAASHSHSYLPTNGGAISGGLQIGPYLHLYSNHIRTIPSDPSERCGIWLESESGAAYITAGFNASKDENVWIFAGNASNPNSSYSLIVQRLDQATFGPAIASRWATSSSRTKKKNIKPLTEKQANKILDVEVVSFDYRKKYGGEKGCRGVIAEDVQKIMPELVCGGENDTDFGVDYSKFTPYLIKKIQMMQKEIDELKAKVM